jgi:hypothetical protein
MTLRKKYLKKLEKLERGRQKRIERSHAKGDDVRSKSATHKGNSTGLELTKAQIESWTTKKTGITPTQGKNADRKAGRTKGRYLKGKL